jgi:hypothetical protein
MYASIFGNEKLAEIVLLLEAEDGALLAAELSRRTGFTHSLVMDVLVRLSKTSAVRALPRAGNPRGPSYFEKCAESPPWLPLVVLARVIAAPNRSGDPADHSCPEPTRPHGRATCTATREA